MISLQVLFWMYVVLFALIGAMRGWAKEILVSAGVVVALFVVTVIENYIPIISESLTPQSTFWVRIGVLGILTFFGYQGPNLRRLIESGRFVRDRFEDVLLGGFLGAVNGYLIFGSAWFFLHQAGYPFDWISAPDPITEAGQKAMQIIKFLPPQWLEGPIIYIAVAIAFVFILVVFI
ncbi:MAG: putative membrane protein [Anaerolineaceae bacterium 46_22]|nr:MAG: putative membrane protein [Anaerolineaceae bacterium 46_22]